MEGHVGESSSSGPIQTGGNPSGPRPQLTSSLSPRPLEVYTWGRGEDGQLGVGDTSDQYKPVIVDAFQSLNIVIDTIACGSGHSVVLSTSGSVYSWGRGDDGRLGHGDNGWKYIPRIVSTLKGRSITMITCGSYHTAAVEQGGKLFTWGGGMYGKLGHGSEDGCSRPRAVDALSDFHVRDIACGSRHTAVVMEEGQVWSWGDKENGVSGHGETEGHQYTPKKVKGLGGVQASGISACGFHTAVVGTNGGIWTWGEGKFGRLGHGNERNVTSPKKIEGLGEGRKFKVACGGFHTAAIADDGEVYTWGGGEHGQLGLGDKTNKMTPTQVTGLDYSVVQITCGWSHTVALSSCGKVFTWGNGDHGKLGHGTSDKVAVPKLVDQLAHLRVTKIASYNEHTAALTTGIGMSHGLDFKSVSNDFILNFKGMVNEEEFSDVTFYVEGRPLYAHRGILSARSQHFRAMFTSGMRESNEKEITIEDINYDTFLALMEYLYCDSIEGLAPNETVDLFGLAQFYNLERLMEMCLGSVRRSIKTDNAAALLQRAHDAHCDEIKELALDYVVSRFDEISRSEGIKALSHELLLHVLQRRPIG